MFGMGSIGNFLPLLGGIGSGFSGGGLLSLGFTLLSGLMTNISNPGFDMSQTHPGFNTNFGNPGFNNSFGHPGFGSHLIGGPSASTVGNATGYFGGQYSGDSYSILPQTPSGQYFGNAGYSYGTHGMPYSPNAPQTYAQPKPGQQLSHLHFGGHFPSYQNAYQQNFGGHTPFYPSYAPGQLSASYGSAPAPYQQSYQPVMSHYGFGSPQQYNPASTLYGHQNGAVKINYGQSHHRTTYGGPQGDDKSVVHHHHHHHFHVHKHDHTKPATEYKAPEPAKPAEDYKPAEPKTDDYKPAETKAEEPKVTYETTPAPDPEPTYGTQDPAPAPPADDYQPVDTDYTPAPTPDPVAYEPAPAPTPDPAPYVAPEPAPDPAPVADKPSTVIATNPVAAQQTSWGLVPRQSMTDWRAGSQMVKDRVTGGDSSSYHFGGQNPATNSDGMMHNRLAVWHVFQQNESLRLDLKSGQFYETKADGTQVNRFHISAVASLERQTSNVSVGAQLVGDFLAQRDLAVPGAARTTPPPAPVNLSNHLPATPSPAAAGSPGANPFQFGLGSLG